MFILQHRKIIFFSCFASRHIMKRYLGLEKKPWRKSLAFATWPWLWIALVLTLEFAASLRLPYGESH